MLIEGERINLRPLAEEDLAKRLEMINDRAVQEIIIGLPGDPSTERDNRRWFELTQEDPYSEQWAIETKAGTYIGDIDLHSIDMTPGEAWFAPMVGDADYRNDADVRKEAVVLVVQYAFDAKELDKLSVEVPEGDRQGVEIYLELGFRQVDEYEIDPFEGTRVFVLEVTRDVFTPDGKGQIG